MRRLILTGVWVAIATAPTSFAQDWWKPYSPPCVERENVFEFTERPAVKLVGKDRYEITFAVKGYCDVTVAIIDPDPAKELVKGRGIVVRHLASGVLGPNAPAPFQKNSLRQTLYWNGKDDLDLYVKEPGKLQVRVMLGLKPEFDKLLGDAGPKNLPGYVVGIAVSPDGAYVMTKALGVFGHISIRKFDLDGNYICSLVPPPANMPEEKLHGLSFVEYEPGKRALHGASVNDTVSGSGFVLPGINGKMIGTCQPAIVGNRLYYCNPAADNVRKKPSLLHYLYTDGSTDVAGMKGLPLTADQHHNFPLLAAAPDGKRLYLSLGTAPVIMVRDRDGAALAKPFVGEIGKPGSDAAHLNRANGIDCDAAGRVYVADHFNNRVQVFAPDGQCLKSIPMDRPWLLRVHQKTGAIYVLHNTRIQGQTLGCLTKFRSFEDPSAEFRVDGMASSVMALDSWSPKPRLWLASVVGDPEQVLRMQGIWGGGIVPGNREDVSSSGGASVQIWEEDGGQLKKIADFDEEAKNVAGANYIGRWGGAVVGGSGIGPKLDCDPTREKAYFGQRVFDLRTGAYLGNYQVPGYCYDDIAFDKKGYMHGHINPGFDPPGGIWRVDPGRPKVSRDERSGRTILAYPEVPYDYGENSKAGFSPDWRGVIRVKDQPGAKYFQDGIGVNMRGDVAEVCNIYHVPRMEESGYEFAASGLRQFNQSYGGAWGKAANLLGSYAAYKRTIDEMKKRGQEVYFIRRQPGVPLFGGTIWTFDATGEQRLECAVIEGKLINGVRIDEDGAVYFVTSRPRIYGDKYFLCGRGGTFGAPDDKSNLYPFTGTLIKTGKDGRCRILCAGAPIPLDPPPARPPELMSVGFPDVFGRPEQNAWAEGAEWMFAGASPIVPGGCSCPTQRFHLDWYRRSFVPEAYRHSIGVLDPAGNLIMHVGRYGNYDSGLGTKSRIPVGGDQIAMFQPRFVAGTDNYLCFTDWGERIVVLKLNYHVEATAPIAAQ